MCLYPTLIKNRKYTVTEKNGGNVPQLPDHRVKYVPVGCGRCMECRKQKARSWQVRLLEDIKVNRNGKFITLTFSNEQLKELYGYVKMKSPHLEGYDIDNEIATVAVRRFRERWRKEYGKSIRHWLVTELGHTGTEHLHMHGIIWTDKTAEDIERHWQYGWVWKGKRQEHTNKLQNYVSGRTVNYIVKYVTKIDKKHKEYRSLILTSKGIGANYLGTTNAKYNAYKGSTTREGYKTSTGHTVAMPIYWRNKIYSESEREQLWLHRLDKEERFVNGERVSIKNGYDEYDRLVKFHREKNTQLGYGSSYRSEEQYEYEKQRRNIKIQERVNAANATHMQPKSPPKCAANTQQPTQNRI